VSPAAKRSESDTLGKRPPVEGLNDEERALLGEALRALRTEAGKPGTRHVVLLRQRESAARQSGLGIDEIKRLARRLGVGPTHWAE
jgi:hypothetical protein